MALGDILAGFAQAGHEHQQNLFSLAVQKQKMLADNYAKLMQDDSYPEEARQQFAQAFQDIVTADPFKIPQINKKYQDMTITVQPKAPKPINIPGQTERPSLPSEGYGSAVEMGPTAGMVSAGATELPQVGIGDRTIQPPTPPPYQRSIMAPFSYDEQMERLAEKNRTQFETMTGPTERLKQSKPTPTGIKYVELDENGDAYQVVQERYRDEETGQWVTTNRRSETPLRAYAPRAALAGALSIDDAIARQVQNPNIVYKDTDSGQPLNLAAEKAAVPNAILVPTGSGNYYVASWRGHLANIGNEVTPVPSVGMPTAQNIGQPLGVARTGSSIDAQRMTGAVDATGAPVMGTFNTSRSVATPGPYGMVPSAPPGMTPMQAPAVAPPSIVPQPPTPRIAAPPRVDLSEKMGQTPPPTRESTKFTTLKDLIVPSQLNLQRQIAMPIREVASSLSENPDNPGLPTLESFAHYATDPEARTQIGAAVDLLLRGAADTGGDVRGLISDIPLAGDMLQWLRQHGVTEEMSKAKVGAAQRALNNPDYAQAVHAIIGAYGTIPGLRVATKGSAYQFYVKNLELELPTLGNVSSGREYFQKLATLMRDVTNATKNLHNAVMDAAEKKRYFDAEQRFTKLSQLSDQELKTADIVNDSDVEYLKGGVGPKVGMYGIAQPKRVISIKGRPQL